MSVAITRRKWLGRVMLLVLAFIVLSVVLGVTDFLRAKRDGKPLFSVAWTNYSDGGTAEYTGLLYTLRIYHRLDGLRGPELWFWYFPIYRIKEVWHDSIVVPG